MIHRQSVRAAIHSAALALTLVIVAAAVNADAQAWTPPARVGSISFLYQAIEHTGHRLSDGTLLPVGKSRTGGLYMAADYAFTDRVSVSVGLPYVFARYIGADIPAGDLPVDMCHCWHSAFQDVTGTARVSVLKGNFALTPSVAVVLPSHAYAYRGESVPGRRLRELQLGVDAGQRLDAISDRLSLSARYTYAIVERVLDVPNNRSNASIEGAFAVSRRLSTGVSYLWQRTHGGLRVGSDPPPPIDPLPWGEIVNQTLFEEHDRLLRDNYFGAGVSMAYSFPRLDVFGSYVAHLGGSNTHAERAVTIGISWPFEIAR